MRPYVLCDIDGTIADITHRRHFVEKKPKDWKSFYAAMDLDKVRKDVLEQLAMKFLFGHKIVFISARPDTYRDQTAYWLDQNIPFEYEMLLMRKEGDSREDSIVKKEILDEFFPNKDLIDVVYDDRPRVIRMWKEQGLDVINVGDGIEF